MMKIITISTLAIILLSYLLFRCTTGREKKKVYYSYSGGITSADFFPGVKKTPTFKAEIVTDSTIHDLYELTPLFLEISFNGEYQYYPKGITLEVFHDEKKISEPSLADITIVTVLNDRVTYIEREDSIFDVSNLISKVKQEKLIPDSVVYFNVSGHFKRIPLGNTEMGKNIKIRTKLKWENGGVEKEYDFQLGEIEYAKPKNRPFG